MDLNKRTNDKIKGDVSHKTPLGEGCLRSARPSRCSVMGQRREGGMDVSRQHKRWKKQWALKQGASFMKKSTFSGRNVLMTTISFIHSLLKHS